MSIDESTPSLSSPGENADDLTATNVPDPLANEQTWPTEEEMEGAGPSRLGGEDGVRTKRVPKGTSAYQAAWIIGEDGGAGDDDDEDDDEDGEDMDEDDGLDGIDENAARFLGDGEETEEIELDSRRSEVHRDLDPEQEERE